MKGLSATTAIAAALSRTLDDVTLTASDTETVATALTRTLEDVGITADGTSPVTEREQVGGRRLRRPRPPKPDDEGWIIPVPLPDSLATVQIHLEGCTARSEAVMGPKERRGRLLVTLDGAHVYSVAETGVINLLDEELVALLMAA